MIWVHSGGIAVDEVMEPFKSPDDAEYLTFNVKTKLRKVCRLLTFLGGFMSMIADTFLLSGLIPCGVLVCQKKDDFLRREPHFVFVEYRALLFAVSMSLVRFLSCSTSDDPYTNVSSVIPVTPSRPSNAVSSCF